MDSRLRGNDDKVKGAHQRVLETTVTERLIRIPLNSRAFETAGHFQFVIRRESWNPQFSLMSGIEDGFQFWGLMQMVFGGTGILPVHDEPWFNNNGSALQADDGRDAHPTEEKNAMKLVASDPITP